MINAYACNTSNPLFGLRRTRRFWYYEANADCLRKTGSGQFAGGTFVAGEIKDPNRNLPKVFLGGLILIIITVTVMAAFAAFAMSSVGQVTLPNGDKWSFYEAYTYLSYEGSLRQAGLPNSGSWLPTVASMAGTGLGLGSLNVLILAFSVLWILNDLPALALTASRLIFAMSFDRVLPVSLSNVNSRFHSPLKATALVAVFGLLGILGESGVLSKSGSLSPGGTLGGILNSIFSNGIYATDLFDAIFFTLFALGLVLLPYRRPQIYAQSPLKPGGKVGVTAIGVAAVLANLVLMWLTLTTPEDSYNILAPTADNWFDRIHSFDRRNRCSDLRLLQVPPLKEEG